MEIERKFLVHAGWQEHVQSSRTIVQGYLSFGNKDQAEPEVRVRLIKEGQPQAFLTVKSVGGLVREENEKSIDIAQAELLITKCKGSLIEKVRHHIIQEGVLFEVDEYQGSLAGLVVAEVELTSTDQKIQLPSWIGEEITELREYKNAVLAKSGRPSRGLKMK